MLSSDARHATYSDDPVVAEFRSALRRQTRIYASVMVGCMLGTAVLVFMAARFVT